MGIIQGVVKNFVGGKTNNETTVTFRDFRNESFKNVNLFKSEDVSISARDAYKGLGFGIIRKIRDTGIVTAEDNIRTTCSTAWKEILAEEQEQIVHPYINLYRNSPYFSEYTFWKKAFTYVMLKGEFYVYVNREPLKQSPRSRILKNKMSDISYMKIINPFEMSVMYDSNGEISGYKQRKKNPNSAGKDRVRIFKPYEIIRFSEDDPICDWQPFSIIVDGAKESTWTLGKIRDFARKALKGNMNTPGVISTGVELDDEMFQNFIDRLESHEDGTPIVANGGGSVNFDPMSQDLSGASQEKMYNMNRDETLIATGTGKSSLGIEQQGLTRDVAATQKISFVEGTVIPLIKLVIETLNEDYRVNYAVSFAINKYIIKVTIPSSSDKTQELKELEIRQVEYEMVKELTDRGYSMKSAVQYVKGEIDVDGLQLDVSVESVKLTPSEAAILLESLAKQQNALSLLIEAGNDPQSVIEYVTGKITIEQFLLTNKDVKPVTIAVDEKDDSDDASSDKKSKPSDDKRRDYDPDDDYGTPRDEKTKTKKKKKNSYEIEKEKIINDVLGEGASSKLKNNLATRNELTLIKKKLNKLKKD